MLRKEYAPIPEVMKVFIAQNATVMVDSRMNDWMIKREHQHV